MTESQKPGRRVLIVGAGQTGRALVRSLSESWEIAVLDVAPAKLDRLRSELPERKLELIAKDGTSLLNLKEAGLESAEWLVATTSDDEVNIEACRVALGVESPPTAIGVARRAPQRDRLKEIGAEAVVRPDAVAVLIKNRIERAHQVASGVGLGQGEIVEIPVLRSSPAVDARVSDLKARRWLVAAIYRDERYVVPHGDVLIREGDRLLLTGEPELLPYIADYLRAGVARFPLQYGVRTVALALRKPPDSFWDEVKYLGERTRTRSVRALTVKSSPPPEIRIGRGAPESQLVNDTDDLLTIVRRDLPGLDCGCLVLPKEDVGFWTRIGLGRASFADALETLHCPLLFAAGSHPYRRILLPVVGLDVTVTAAELAIDLARQIDIGITAVAVTPPPFIVGQEAVAVRKETLRAVMEVGSLYHRKLESVMLEGNPAKEVARLAGPGDLLVVGLEAGRGSSFFRPDTALQIVYRSPSSVLAFSQRKRRHGTV
jgi:Trk K+ transport system NAD-binding subunit/nucleotide-binding universal stress UspA family protein